MCQHDLSDIWDWDILAAITPGVLDNSVIQVISIALEVFAVDLG